MAFWAHSLVFLLASILVPKLLIDLQAHDIVLVATLVVAAFVARLAVLFGLIPLLSLARLTKPISTAYKLAIAWGGLRGALTLVLALSVTENPAVPPSVQRFVAVLATGLVFFTLLVNGTTLRLLIRALGLDRLSPADQVLRDGCSRRPTPTPPRSFASPPPSTGSIRRRRRARSRPTTWR